MSKKRLVRKKERALLAGVIAGLADYFDQDPVLLRLVAIILLILTGIFPGALFYVAAWVLMPEQETGKGFDYEVKD